MAIGFAIGVVTLGAVVLAWNHDQQPTQYALASPAQPAAAPVVSSTLSSTGFPLLEAAAPAAPDPAVARVAAQFTCSCADRCGKTVDVCTCETAQTERAFLQRQLKEGRTEAEAAQALKQTYGGLKL